jgi:HD-like signal output (HDOD) protein
VSSPAPAPTPAVEQRKPAPPSRPAGDVDASGLLGHADIEFLTGLIAPPELKHLDELPKPDQLFLGGIVRKLHARTLELPVFPEAAVRLSELLRQGDAPMSRYAALIGDDPALSLEVLKVANSAFYGASTRTTSLNDAIVRVGLARLQSIMLLTHLTARLLKGGTQRKAELLLDLALPTAALASRLAPQRGTDDLRFMRGMLLHVEHLVILGTVADVQREQRSAIMPSSHALHQAFDRFGADIREAVASAWKLKEILLGSPGQDDRAVYAGLRDAVVSRWLDLPLPAIPGVDATLLNATMVQIAPRVTPSDEALTA